MVPGHVLLVIFLRRRARRNREFSDEIHGRRLDTAVTLTYPVAISSYIRLRVFVAGMLILSTFHSRLELERTREDNL